MAEIRLVIKGRKTGMTGVIYESENIPRTGEAITLRRDEWYRVEQVCYFNRVDGAEVNKTVCLFVESIPPLLWPEMNREILPQEKLVFEDELPEMTDGEYAKWFAASRVVDGVRMGPPIEGEGEEV
jgi:hypothetical protein